MFLFLKQIKIIHIYGQIAKFGWQYDPIKKEIAYGSTDYQDIGELLLTNNIKIVNEVENSPEIEEAHKTITKAQRVFFLGFGYREENLKILNLPHIIHKGQNIHGTAFEAYEQEIARIKFIFKEGNRIIANDIGIFNMDNLELLRRYL